MTGKDFLKFQAEVVQGKCPVRFESMYECLQFGYNEASKKLAEIGPDKVNEAYAHIKFYCQPISEV
jgi:hypothetical protein